MKDKLKVLDLFSGIGGFSLSRERTSGFETVAFCEIEEFPRKVLAKRWPEIRCYEDVTKLTSDILKRDGISVDVITGGFPCQDVSTAGNQAGIGEGTRSGLWSECHRLLGEIRPKYAVFENVTNLLSGPSGQRGGWFSRVLGDLAKIGYSCEWHSITASSIGAVHKRNRVWIICYPNESCKSDVPLDDEAQIMQRNDPNTNKSQFKRGCISERIYEEHAKFSDSCWRKDKPGVDRTLDGAPSQMDRLGCLGNAVIPQIPEMIGYAIL